METKKFCILNKTRESSLSKEATLVDSTFEPLTVLRVMVEGLTHSESAGLWLTKVSNLPAVPRISPFDLIYLDRNNRVVEATELLPVTPMPPFKSPAHSALVLPFQTLSSTETSIGDELAIQDRDEIAKTAAPAAVSVAAEGARPNDDSIEAVAAVVAQEEPQLVVAEAPAAVDRDETAIASEGKARVEEPAGAELAAPSVPVEVLRIVEAIDRAVEAERIENDPPLKAAEAVSNVDPASEAVLTEETTVEVQPEVAASESLAAETEAERLTEEAKAPESAEREIEAESQPEKVSAEAAGAIPATGAAKELLHASRSKKQRGRKQRAKVQTKAAFAGPRKAVNRAHFVVRSDEPAPATAEASRPAPEPVTEREVPKPLPAIPLVRTEPRIVVNSSEPEFEHRPVASSQPEARETVTAAPAAKAEEPIIGRFLRWLYPAVYQEERRGSIRLPNPGLVAYEFNGNAYRKYEVGNISSSGLYLVTADRLKQGAMLSLTLQKNGLPEQRADRRIELLAGAVRAGRDGIGLTFSFPHGVNLDLWDAAVKGNVTETGPDYIIREIRMARALGFLGRICNPAVERARQMFYKEFSNVRIANAIRIVLKAENLIMLEPDVDEMRAHPDMVARILELGSWVDLEWMQDLWAGLLATSCTYDGQDESNLPFVEMLSQFAPVHLRILAVVCSRAAAAERAGGDPDAPAFCTAGELAKALDMANMSKILRTVAELADYGLLYKAIRSASSPHDASAKTAATPLGQQMYAHCHGERFDGTLSGLPVNSLVIPMQAYEEASGFLSMRHY